jgi:ribonucleoside-diphosphate reductase beta chain
MTFDARTKLFNFDVKDYTKTPLFLGEDPGLADTIHRSYPAIRNIYKKLKAQDWDENEFNFFTCKNDFQTCSPATYDIFIKTLSWQWEADTVVSRSVSGIGANITTNSDLNALWQRIAENESLHAFTYSEIVRSSFDDPGAIIEEVVRAEQAKSRLKPLIDNLENMYVISHRLALGLERKDDPKVYDAIILYMVAMLLLERVQFIPSFYTTFAVAETGLFVPAANAIQKISIDELEIHSVADLTILDIEKNTPRGLEAMSRLMPQIQEMIKVTVETEKNWCDYIFSEGRQLPGVDSESLFGFTMYCAKPVYDFFNLKPDYETDVITSPKFVEKWFNIDRMQFSPQEQKTGNYLLGGFDRSGEDDDLDIDI